MSAQMVSNILERTTSQKNENGIIPIGFQMQQLSVDFSNCNLVTDAIEAESFKDAPALFETPVEDDQTDELAEPIEFDNGSYVQLAISLLLTCAEDLVKVDKVIENPASKERDIRRALNLKKETISWLRNELPDAPFTFHDCVSLLEDELRLQSLDQIELPAIVERSDELASWIINDSQHAKHILGRYLTIFSRNEEEYWADDDNDVGKENASIRDRPRL